MTTARRPNRFGRSPTQWPENVTGKAGRCHTPRPRGALPPPGRQDPKKKVVGFPLRGAESVPFGLRAADGIFELGFVPLTAARCDRVIAEDLLAPPTAIPVVLDALRSRQLRREIGCLPGRDSSVTGRPIAALAVPAAGQA